MLSSKRLMAAFGGNSEKGGENEKKPPNDDVDFGLSNGTAAVLEPRSDATARTTRKINAEKNMLKKASRRALILKPTQNAEASLSKYLGCGWGKGRWLTGSYC